MPIRRSPNGVRHIRPQPGRNRPEWVVAINRNAWSQSVGTGGRNHPVRSAEMIEAGIAAVRAAEYGLWESRSTDELSTLVRAIYQTMLAAGSKDRGANFV